ncbi:hypothetical protein ACRYCC_14900 [Actinomadura scrupuli]|uniref:hypothetical protein n=1 Tax=Actinomadura scrupuli TaxID=559629 RepID=UPI003D99A122
MSDIETRLRDAFETHAGTVRPHAEARAENRRRVRRSRIRRRSALSAAVATGVLVTGGVAGLREEPGTAGPGTDSLSSGLRRLTGSPAPATLIRGRLPGGAAFHADTLGADGSVLGRSADSAVWKAGPYETRPVPLGIRARGGLGIGRGLLTWIEPGAFDLKCRSSDGRTRTISPQSADPDGPLWVQDGVVIWQDVMHQPFVAKGCAAPGRIVPGDESDPTDKSVGDMVAVDYPTLFSVNPINGPRMKQVEAPTGRVMGMLPLPAGVRVPVPVPYVELTPARPVVTRTPRPHETPAVVELPTFVEQPRLWSAAAGHGVFAWAVDGVLRLTHDGASRTRPLVVPARLPKPKREGQTTVTVGNRFVVYSTTTTQGRAHSVVYDLRTRTTMTWPGEARTAGDWLLWRDGTDYRLAHVR